MSEEAVENLRENQWQVDADGSGVGVSRQALHEALDYFADLQRQLQEARAGHVELPPLPERLHPETADLVRHFCRALAVKLYRSEKKYGYSNGWADTHWLDECREKLVEHIGKGDPIDVAAYCAFLWHHDEPTALSSGLQEARKDAGRYRWLRERGISLQNYGGFRSDVFLDEYVDTAMAQEGSE